MLHRNGKNLENGDFDWKDAVIDSSIMASVTFFSALGGTAAVNIPTAQSCVIAGIAAFTQFFIMLAIKRGLGAKSNNQNYRR